jgi:hypothetical protein
MDYKEHSNYYLEYGIAWFKYQVVIEKLDEPN